MQVSIIIPTYNRVNDLEETLDSIIIQTTLPKEIIIVDDSDNDEIETLVEHRKNEFRGGEIFLKYIRNEKEKSLTIARNIGIEKSIGDVILFLDDDVVLDKNYISEILRIYKDYPNALGVQGYITYIVTSKFLNIINKILFRGYFEKAKCRILPSGYSTYPYLLDKVVTCQWLSGANHSYRRELLQRFRYDGNLKRYSYVEDADLSYRVYKKYLNSLYITPYARLIHKASEEGKLPNKTAIQMKQIYTLYFFYKHIDQSIMNKMIVIWSRIGYLIRITSISILSLIIRGSKSGLVTAKYTISAYITCMKHLNEIKKGDLEFFNKRLR
jgi:GT2 family glycosyltransferase